MSTKRINLISGPRNISTALMYSFGNRKDTTVVDEPMYAYYLDQSGVVHPGGEEVLRSLPTDLPKVLSQYIFNPVESPIYFIKGMAHHYYNISDTSFLGDLVNVFLIRNPKKLIASFAQVISNPTMQDIGLKKEWELYNHLTTIGQEPIIMDSGEVLQNPRKVLTELCEKINIPFSEEMLSWSAGARSEDGVWAQYWYESVWQSTGFAKQKSSDRELPKHLYGLYEESKIYYDKLYHQSLKA